MKGFQDWFTEKNGFWPARPHENTANVLARLCDEVAQFVDQATGRGDYAEIEPVPLIGQPIMLSYKNYRGEISTRRITPLKPWYGSTEWHPEPQWLLKAFDHDKGAERDFALADFGAPAVKLELIRTVSETPVSSHGGPAAGISWELKLNGVLIEREYHRMHWSDRDRSLLDPIPSMKRKLEDLKAALGCTTRDPLETAGLDK